MPRWASSIGVLGGVYVVIMLAAALWLPHEWDWSVFELLSSHAAPALSDQVRIVDVQWDPNDVPANRLRLARFLNALVASKEQPRAVLLDVEFDPCQSEPCDGKMEAARDALVASIRNAARRFPVYALEQVPVDRDDNELSGPSGHVDRHDERIYGAVTGAGHTVFTTIPHTDGLFYRTCYAQVPFVDATGKEQGTETVWALVDLVLMQPGFVATCDGSHVPVRLGAAPALSAPLVASSTDAHALPPTAQLDKKFVIVGTVEIDRSAFVDRSGPEILGWALSNALDRASPISVQTYYETHPPNGMLLVLVPVFSVLAVLAFTAVFFSLKRLRLRGLRYLLPWISAVVGATVGLVIFGAFEWWLFNSRQIQPQVSLVSLGIVLASGLSGFRAFQMLADEKNAVDLAPAEVHDYDVFVSYAHDEGAWVAEHVYRPLSEARLPDGKKLSIFFDTSSIRSGSSWQDKIALAIDSSRFIVPVYSDVYFTKPYCRFEIKRAHRKWISLGEDSRCVLPIMRGHPKIYGTVDDIQALSLDDHPGLVQQIVDEIVESVVRRSSS